MKTASPVSPLPVPEPVQHKTDNLDWKNLPLGTCEFEFRLAHVVTPRTHLMLVALMALASLLSPLVAWTLARWPAPLFAHWWWGTATVIVGVCWFSTHEYRRLSHSTGKVPFCFSSLKLLFGPIFPWLTIMLTTRLQQPSGAFAYYVVVAVPVAFFLSDRIATHAIHWFSAALLLDYNTKTSWRKDWEGRFLEDPTIQPPLAGRPAKTDSLAYQQAMKARQGYFVGVLWLYGAILLPCFLIQLVAANPKRETIGLQIVVGQFSALCLAAWLRSESRLSVFRRVVKESLHWLHYDTEPTAPWCFRSPCGTLHRRRMLTILAVGLLAVAIYSLMLPPLLYLGDSRTHVPTSLSQNPAASITPAGGFATPTIVGPISLRRWILGGVVLLAGIPLPPTFLFLMVTILIGPVLTTYQKALRV